MNAGQLLVMLVNLGLPRVPLCLDSGPAFVAKIPLGPAFVAKIPQDALLCPSGGT